MNKSLIKKFLDKKCNEEELQQVYRWLNDPWNAEEVTALLKNSWHQMSDKKPEADVDMEKLRQQTMERLCLKESAEEDTTFIQKDDRTGNFDMEKGKAKRLRPRHRFSWLRVAAMIILLEGIAFLAYKHTGNSDRVQEYTEKTTLEGQKYTLFLKDGSKVILNSNSSLRYDKDFGETSRNLILEGEAFFEVAKDPTKPFSVKTNSITTVALGTSFNIKANPNANTFSISLLTGKVEISGENKGSEKFVLAPGEELVFERRAKKFSKTFFNPKERMSWKDGIIYFRDKNLLEAIRVLEKWYGVEFEVINPEKANSEYGNINGEFKNESLANVLKVMSFAKGFKYNITGKKVVIQL